MLLVLGDHGGESLDEIQAAMFVFSKQPLLSLNKQIKSVKQVDLVPTLSAILGIPIPFQNLGVLIDSILPALGTDLNHPNFWQMPLFLLWGNVKQIISYIKTYSENTDIFDRDYLNLYYKEYEILREELHTVDSKEKFEIFSEKVKEFLIKIRLLCEDVWIQFDPFAINNGLTFLFLSIFFMYIICDGIPLKHLPLAIEGSFIVVCVIGVSMAAILILILDFSDIIENVMSTCFFITNVLSNLMFLLPVFQNWDVISINWHTKNQTYDIINLVCRFLLVFSICGVFSNSFINEESSVLLFLLVTIIVLSLLGVAVFLKTDPESKRKGDTVSMEIFVKLAMASLVVLALLRSSMYFWRCRVEQEWCFKTPHEIGNNYKLKSSSSKLQWGVSVISLSALLSLTKVWLRKCGNLNGYSITEIITKLIPNVVVVCIAGFWVLQRLAGNSSSITRTSNYLALSVYLLSSISIIVLIIRPICVSVISRSNASSLDDENVISNIFNKLKGTFNKETENNDSMPIVCGLGTAYSAAYIILASYVTLIIALVLGDLFAFSTVIMIVVGSFFLLTTSVLRIKTAETIGKYTVFFINVYRYR